MKRIQRVVLLAISIVGIFLIVAHPRRPTDSLLNIRNFHYTIQQPSCQSLGVKPLVAIVVHSAPGNFRKRQTIRETWASWKRQSRVVFLVGQSVGHQDALVREASLFGDLIQGSFLDTYRNLTYKHTLALKWGYEECPEAPYVFKVQNCIHEGVASMFYIFLCYISRLMTIFLSIHQHFVISYKNFLVMKRIFFVRTF